MAYDTFLATCIRVSLALSAWQLMQTSLAAQDDRTLAFATAVVFLVLCLFVHAPPIGLIVRRRELLAVVLYLMPGSRRFSERFTIIWSSILN